MTTTAGPPAVTVDVVSDVMCPWCFIGKRRLEEAIALVPDIPLDIRWRPYQLDPTLPPEGRDREDYLNTKFGGPERAAEIYATIEHAGRDAGIEFRFDLIRVSPNTLDAHRLIRWSYSTGLQDALVEALFAAFFLEGRNIGETDVLVDIAEAVGMDATLVRTLLDNGADRDAVEKEVQMARDLGIGGVPCFIIANAFAVQGAQKGAVLADAIQKASAHLEDQQAAV